MTQPLTILLGTIGRSPADPVAILSKGPDDADPMITTWTTVADAAEQATLASRDGTHHVWYGVQPMTRPATGRGKSKDVTSVVTLYADLDYYDAEYKPSGLTPLTAQLIIGDLADLLAMEPSALVASGNGVQPYWPIEPVDQITGAMLLLRWRQLVLMVAAKHAATIDTGVYDLPRILRVPGPRNPKHGLDKPTHLLKPYTATRLTAAQLNVVFDSYLPKQAELSYSGVLPSGALRLTDRSVGSDRVFDDAEASAYLAERLAVIRDTPWGAGADYWKVLWEQTQGVALFAEMYPEDDLKGMIRKAIEDGHGAPANQADEYQIALGFIKFDGEYARRPNPHGNPFGPDAKYVVPTRIDDRGSKPSWLNPSYTSTPAPTSPSERFKTGRTCDATGAVADEPLSALFADPDFPMFGHVRQFARSRGVNPVAVLGVVLTRIAAAIPPCVVTPALIGGHGSLNAFLCLVGRAGMSKGGATKAAEEAVRITMHHEADGVFVFEGPIYSPKIGSGQGVAAQYCYRERPDKVTGAPGVLRRERDSVLFTCFEVSDMTAKSGGSSTLLQTICEMWVAEPLGSSYVDPTKRLPVAGMGYRACFLLHAQPDLMAPLLIDAAPSGAPQRFLYLPVADAFRPDDRPDEPAPLEWSTPRFIRTANGRTVVPVCQLAEWAILDHNGRMHEGLADPLDGHTLFATLKTAVAINATRGLLSVDEASWKHAVALHALSRQTRSEVIDHLREQKRVMHREVAKAEGHKALIVAEVVQEVVISKGRQRVLDILGAVEPFTLTKAKIQTRCSRTWDAGAFNDLCSEGVLVWKDVPTGNERGRQEITVYALAAGPNS